jgi:hypothetical protein
MYMTPARLRSIGSGIDLVGISDLALRSLCDEASAMVDTYCNVPLLPQRHSFLGGTITNEKHNWDIGTDQQYGTRRFWPWHTPIKDVLAFRIDVTNSQHVDIVTETDSVSRQSMYVNESSGYVEVVALAVTSIGVFGSGLVPNLGLARPVGVMKYTYGYDFDEVDEPLMVEVLDDIEATTSDSVMPDTYRAQNQFWDLTVTPVVKIDGVTKTPTSDYTFNSIEGTVKLVTPTAGLVTLTYRHNLPGAVAAATGETIVYLLGQRELASKGMEPLEEVHLGELSVRKPRPLRGVQMPGNQMPDAAKLLLGDYIFGGFR